MRRAKDAAAALETANQSYSNSDLLQIVSRGLRGVIGPAYKRLYMTFLGPIHEMFTQQMIFTVSAGC